MIADTDTALRGADQIDRGCKRRAEAVAQRGTEACMTLLGAPTVALPAILGLGAVTNLLVHPMPVLAEELTILANRAYDRLRVALVAEGRATSVGPSSVRWAGIRSAIGSISALPAAAAPSDAANCAKMAAPS